MNEVDTEARREMENGTRNHYSPTCSVVVCTRNRPAQLDQCIASLARLDYPAYDVLVVDNAPTDQRSREVALRWGVRYVTEPVRGLSRARNRGARSCESEIVAYIDDDAIAEPDWLTVLTREFEDPLVAVVTGEILPSHLPGEVAPPESTACVTDRRQRRVVDRATSGWFEIANFGALGDGSNMAFRRSSFDVWPGFEENLGRGTVIGGGEEHYAFFTLIERGYRVLCNPEAIVRHPVPGASEEVRRRHLNLLATTTAYMMRLAVEHSSYWGTLARYLFDRLRGATPPWMEHSTKPSHRIAPRWLSLVTMFSGPWIYLRSRLAQRVSGTRRQGVAKNFENTPLSTLALRDKTCNLES